MFGNRVNINELIPQARETENAILIDVRNKDEFAMGYIPGAVNIPLSDIQFSMSQIGDTARPVFVYCLSGARSKQACANLKKMGYENVTNCGGIASWDGEIVK